MRRQLNHLGVAAERHQSILPAQGFKLVLHIGEIMTHQTISIKVKNGEQNVFVSFMNQNRILLSIYCGNGSMNVALDKGQVEELIDALEKTQLKIGEVAA
jgi:hypothetical protein